MTRQGRLGPGTPKGGRRRGRSRQDATWRRHGDLNVAAVMMMADRYRPVTVPTSVGIGNLVRSHMDMSRVVIVTSFDLGDSGPVRCMGKVVVRLRHAMQVHGRQEGDAQTDAEMAKGVIQISRLRRSV